MAESSNSQIDDYKLIKLYEGYPLLWDTRLSDYFSATERKGQTWKDIADQLGSNKGNKLVIVI